MEKCNLSREERKWEAGKQRSREVQKPGGGEAGRWGSREVGKQGSGEAGNREDMFIPF